MFYAAIAILCIAVALGLWLSAQYLIEEKKPPIMSRVAAIHGSAGALCVALLYLSLHHAGHSAGKFGWTAFIVLAAALAGGLTILSFHLRGKQINPTLVAMHASAGMAGAVMLAAYFASPASFAH
jgi:peptidoglycan biosynthesis protein MviN/MurJ (putative lipid II flippase)